MESSRNINISNSTIIRVVLFGLLLYVLWVLQSVVLVTLTAVVIASFVESGVNRFKNYGISRVVSVVLIYATGLLIVAGLFSLIIPKLSHEIVSVYDEFKNTLPALEVVNTAEKISDRGVVDKLGGMSVGDIASTVDKISSRVSAGFFGSIVNIFGGVANFLLIIIISFFLSIEEKGIEKFLKIVTPLAHESYVVSLWRRTSAKISKWVQGQMLLGLIVGLLSFIGLTILGVPYALLLSLIVAIFELVPFGMILAAVPAIIMGFIDGGVSLAVMTTLLFFVIQMTENYIWVPLIIRKATGLPPLVIILSLLVGAKLAGFWGVILAIPMAVFLLELLSDIEQKKFSLKG